ncbi:FAD-dependent oxidoreductase [Nocardioides mangrovicus]|uniref:FAD-dependent oxidoreductase n=1 Tax=Nocardioides mangrovicus TaxID=2478913 RepID=A0A3L8P6L8_9ACTN|nr:FAD-dependent oxidoreductase [Nocardioides mangrovicus]RLV50353.1 FAD-dependent oxidoreductase [Nocardioides mangrovicus]
MTRDVVVVGAGLAGLATAVRATELGLSVLVLEKTDRPGGSSAMSGGWFAFSGTPEQQRLGIEDDDERFVRDMVLAGGGRPRPELVRAYVAHQGAAYAWSRELGADYDVVKLSAGQSVPRSHHTDVLDLLGELRRRLEQAPGAELRTASPAARLDVGESGVPGVPGVTGVDGIRAGLGVVLASGGFTRSPELIELFAPAQLAALPYGGRGNTGDGLRMAMRLGAGLADTGYVSGTFGSHPDTGEEEHELLTAFYLGAVILNRAGERFVDESLTYKELGQAVLRQPGAMAFEVFDQQVRDRSEPGVPLSDIGHLEDKGRLLVADSLPQLAGRMGIAAERLEHTVASYNRAAVGEAADPLGRTHLCNGVGDLVPLTRPPFFAYPARTLMTSTFGGVRVDEHTRVLDLDGVPVPGLHAVGEVSGGLHGTSYVTGTALGKALIGGRLAAEVLER